MTIVIRAFGKALLNSTPAVSKNKYLHAAANLLCLNPVMSPAIELKEGALSIEADAPFVAAVTGEARVVDDGQRAAPWSALRASRSLEVYADREAYVALRGLKSGVSGRLPLPPEYRLELSSSEVDGIHSRVLAALKVPPSLRVDAGDWLEAASRLQRYLEVLADVVRRGAELVRVSLGGVEYEAWVLELR